MPLQPIEIYDYFFKAMGKQYWWPAKHPTEMMIGAILVQNTAWKNVEKALMQLQQAELLDFYQIFKTKEETLAQLIKPAGFFNVKAKRLKHFCDWYVREGGFEALKHFSTEELRQKLLAIHGIGKETADCILLYAFQKPIFVVDAYTKRIFSRLGLISEKASYDEIRQYFEANLPKSAAIYNEYHALIVKHAILSCKKKPLCDSCILKQNCPKKIGD